MRLENTSRLIGRVRHRALLLSFIRHFLVWVCCTALCLLLMAFVDYGVHLPLIARRMFYYLSAAGAALLLARFLLLHLPGRITDERLVLFAQERLPAFGDRLINAWQLSRKMAPGTSEELAAAHAADVEREVARYSVGDILPVYESVRRPLLGGVVCLSLIGILQFLPAAGIPSSFQRILLSPALKDWERWFEVSPGNARVAWSSDVEITIKRKRPVGGVPLLSVRSGKDGWRKVVPEERQGGYTAAVRQLTVETGYRVTWNDWESPVYVLTPVMPVRLGGFTVTYIYPKYTGLGAQTVHDVPAVSGLPGTVVRITAKANRQLRTAAIETDYGDRYPAQVNGESVSVRFTLKKDGFYHFAVEDAGGAGMDDPAGYPITLLKDRPPDIELLSPTGDLVVAPRSEVPLVARIGDDYGVTAVDLVYRIGGGSEKRVTARRFAPAARQETVEHVIDLSRLSLKPGDRLRYYLEAWDNNTVAGPRSSVTPTMVLEATDYEREHDRIEDGLKDMRQALMNVLADQMAVREQTKSLAVNYSTAAWQGAVNGQKAVRKSLESPLRQLEGLLSKMESDPLTDFSTQAEYRGIQSHLAQVSRQQLPAAEKELSGRDFAAAGRQQDEVIASLEKLSLLSEDVWQYQRMQDVLDAGSELEKAGKNLLEGLGENADAAALKDTLSKIGELMDRINRQIAKLPQELPEDFVNAPAMKQLNLGEARDLASRIADAIAKGDLQQARELAAELQKSLQEMARTMGEAGKDVGFTKDAAQEQRSEIEKIAGELQGIIGKQESLAGKIGAIDEAGKKELFKKQESLLPALAERQQRLVERAEKVTARAAGTAPAYVQVNRESLPLMLKVLEEFRQRRVFHAQKYLEDTVRLWGAAEHCLDEAKRRLGESVYQEMAQETGAIGAGEKAILDELKKPPAEGIYSGSDVRKMNALGEEETALSGRTQHMKRSLDEFLRKSAAVQPETFENMENAADAMKGAAQQLSAGNAAAAAESSRRALDLLRQGGEGLEAAGSSMGERGQNAGTPRPTVRIRSGGGITGFRSVPVRLPRADEYKVPRAFRQELLEGLKEKYPLQYEKIIKEYYRRLAQ